MTYDFEQLVGDTRKWLLKAKPKPSFKNEVGQRGWLRRQQEALTNPVESVVALEVTSFFDATLRVGSLMVSATFDGRQPRALLLWDEDDVLSVKSPLTLQPDRFVPILELTGILTEQVYERFAIPLSSINTL
jgi:hypothetical protein